MKESYRKGVASHPGPEPCPCGPQGRTGSVGDEHQAEPPNRGARKLGQGHMQAGYPEGVSSEIAKSGKPTVSGKPEGNSATCDSASAARPCGVADPKHAWKLHAREPRDPAVFRGRKAAER